MILMKKYFPFLLLLMVGAFPVLAQNREDIDPASVGMIWNEGIHNAFGDIVRFRNAFYVSVREGVSHVGSDNVGKVRIIKSKDGKKWKSVALLEIPGIDLRDPKLSITPEDKIMVTMAGAVFGDGVAKQLFPMVAFSDKRGDTFTTPENAVLDPAIDPSLDWVWRVTWHDGTGYAIDYQLKENDRNRKLLKKDAWLVYLMRTTDGKYYEKVALLEVEDLPNEATVRISEDGTMYGLVRREAGDQLGVLGQSRPPYTDWSFSKLDFRLGGPNFLFLENEKLVLGTRLYGEHTQTGILVTDLKGKVLKTIALPSGGDTSYPGMLFHGKELWVVYYSSHEGKSQIYLAKIPRAMLEI